MELTDDILKRIAFNIADLKIRVIGLRYEVVRLGGKPEEIDQATNQMRQSPDFQQICDGIFEQLKGGH